MRRLVALVGLMACGGDDAAVTADADTSPNVTVSVTAGVVGRSGLRVIAVNADDTLAADVLTDGSGEAEMRIAPDATVTLVDTELMTYGNVMPGDHLVFASPAPLPSSTFTITVPNDTGANRFVAYACGSSIELDIGVGVSGTFTDVPCRANEDLLVVTYQTATMRRSLYAPGIATTGTVAITGTYEMPTAVTLNIANGGAGVARIARDLIAPSGSSVYSALYQGDLAAGSVTLTSLEPTATAVDFTRVQVLDDHGAQNLFVAGPRMASATYDFAPLALPAYADNGAYDSATRTMSWSVAAGGVTPQVTLLYLSWLRGDDGFEWRWLGKYGGSSVKFPTLPADVTLQPQVGEAVRIGYLQTATLPGGFATVHETGLSGNPVTPVGHYLGAMHLPARLDGTAMTRNWRQFP